MLLLPAVGVAVTIAVCAWSASVLTDAERYVSAVAPLCGNRWTSAIAAFVMCRRVARVIGPHGAVRLHPILRGVVSTGANSRVAAAAWVNGNLLLHRHRRIVRIGPLPRSANPVVMLMLAAAGRFTALVSGSR